MIFLNLCTFITHTRLTITRRQQVSFCKQEIGGALPIHCRYNRAHFLEDHKQVQLAVVSARPGAPSMSDVATVDHLPTTSGKSADE